MQSKLFGHRSVSRKGYFSRVNRRGASRQHMVRPGKKARTRWTKTTAQTTAPASVYPHVIFGPVKPSAALLVLRLFCCSRLYVAAGRTHRPRTRARRVCWVLIHSVVHTYVTTVQLREVHNDILTNMLSSFRLTHGSQNRSTSTPNVAIHHLPFKGSFKVRRATQHCGRHRCRYRPSRASRSQLGRSS